MYIGSNQEKVNLAFSTAAKISIINSANCLGCDRSENKGFEYQRSHSIKKISEKILEVSIAHKTKAQGILVYDDVKLTKDSDQMIHEFPFLLVNKWNQTTFEKDDGIIGLSRTYWTIDGHNSGSTLLNSLYQANMITQKVFSIHFDDFGGSLLEFGGFDQSKIAPGKTLTYLETP